VDAAQPEGLRASRRDRGPAPLAHRVVVGKYQEIHEDPLEADSRRRAEQLFQERSTWWLPGAAAVSDRPREHAVMFRITIERLTGRRARREERSAWF
jgi:nitroimidazol reductase NimA-like FMN-containing flavoprotein (pyridoxamine 5'-phosphate oxidase superfamily)